MGNQSIVLNDRYADLPSVSDTKLSTEERKAILGQMVNKVIGWSKGRVGSQTDTEAVVIIPKQTKHVVHAILSLVTLGLWLVVWFFVALLAREKQVTLRVDEYGQITQLGP